LPAKEKRGGKRRKPFRYGGQGRRGFYVRGWGGENWEFHSRKKNRYRKKKKDRGDRCSEKRKNTGGKPVFFPRGGREFIGFLTLTRTGLYEGEKGGRAVLNGYNLMSLIKGGTFE